MLDLEQLLFDRPRQPWMDDRTYELYQAEYIARTNMLNRRNRDGGNALILVKAQHPLLPSGDPGPEYAKRLDKALEIISLIEDNYDEIHIVTVGGIHAGNDNVPLAKAGYYYLVKRGIDPSCIFMHPEAMSGYKEDAVAAQYFIDDPDFCEFHVVCSIGQIDRSYLTFISLGIQPTFDPITFLDSSPNHSLVCEQRGSWGVPAFFQEGGNDAVRKAAEAIRQRHLAEAKRGSTPNEEATADDEPSQDNPDDQDDSNG